MAGSVNKVILLGNLGRDPELKTFEGGGAVISFPLATTESYRNRETGEKVVLPTDWHSVTVRKSGLIKIVEAYLKKGDRVYVEGKIRYRSYEKDGVTRYITEVVADDLTLLGGQREGGSGDRSAESTSQGASGDDSGSDDLPF